MAVAPICREIVKAEQNVHVSCHINILVLENIENY